ncbi:UxaA family hydrolase [Colwellia maritima]|uniref:UxaA family hydrolase n=1 Tax=Colwellia maritima TaxID=2912588 RepID=UPI003084514E
MKGYLRSDGRKGIRNVVLVTYLVECAHHVARAIVSVSNNSDVQLIGFPGCYPNEYSLKIMEGLCTHPNVFGVLIVSLGCEGFNREQLANAIEASGRKVDTLVIQKSGGTKKTIDAGIESVRELLVSAESTEIVPMDMSELVVGTICGGSDGTGIGANPTGRSLF